MKKSKVAIRKLSTDCFIKTGVEYPDNDLIISKEEITLNLEKLNEKNGPSNQKILDLIKSGLAIPGEKYWKITYLVPCSENKDFIDNLIISLLKTRRPNKISSISSEIIKKWLYEDPKKIDLRKDLIIRSQCKYPIELVDDWDKWASTDERKKRIIISGSPHAIKKIQSWAKWAKTDSLRKMILKSRSPHAIKKIKDWAQWAKTDEKKFSILRSGFPEVIKKINGWTDWVNTDQKRYALLKSKCPYVIKQIKDWASWANSDDKKDQIFKSQCGYAVQEISNKEWAEFLKKRNLSPKVFKYRMTVKRVAEIKELLEKNL